MPTIKPFQLVVHNDLDGGASAICIIEHIKQKYGPEATYGLWTGTYKKVDAYVERLMDWPEKYEHVFIADIHIHEDLARQLPDNFTLLDHHSSAQGLEKYPRCIIDTRPTVCGATLCYKHLLLDLGYKCDHLKKLVGVACDYDTWTLKLPNNIAKNLNSIYYYYWGEKFVERFKNGFDNFNDEEKEFLKTAWAEIKRQIETTEYIDLMATSPEHKNKFCLITIMDKNPGEVNELCEHVLTNLKYEVVICVSASKKRISTRSSKRAAEKGLHIGNLHVELNIGGGHPQAGGAQYEDENHLEIICETLANKIIQLGI